MNNLIHDFQTDFLTPQENRHGRSSLGCPLTELGTLLRIYAVSDRYNNVQIIKFNLSFDLSFTFNLNRCIFCNSCSSIKLSKLGRLFSLKKTTFISQYRTSKRCFQASHRWSPPLQSHLNNAVLA